MSDLDRFKAFFDSMGVDYEQWTGDHHDEEAEILTCGGGHFIFVEGRFVGVEDDETGHFNPRKEVTP